MKSGNLKFLEPSGPLQACNGTELPICLYYSNQYSENEERSQNNQLTLNIEMHASFLFCQVIIITPRNCVFHFRRSCAACAHVRGSVRCGLLATLFSATTANCHLHYHSCRAPHHVLDMPPKGILRITTLAEFITEYLAGHRKEVYLSSFLQISSQYVSQATERTCTCHHSCGFPHKVPGKQPKGSVRITTLTEFLTMCLAGHRKEVYVSPLLLSSSQYVSQATKRTCTCHHSCGFPHKVPGKQPKGSGRITTLTDFLTMCLAGHRKEVYVSSFLKISSQYVSQATKRTCACHHSFGVPHGTTGRPPKGSVRYHLWSSSQRA
jgi:hypothetical protein